MVTPFEMGSPFEMGTPLEYAEAFIEAGELDDALDALNQHLEAHPEDGEARRLRIDVLIRLPGRAREALTELNMLPDLTEWDYVKRFGALAQLGLSGEVADVLVQAYLKSGGSQALAQLVFTVLYQQGASDQALELLAALPRTRDWLIWSGKFQMLKGDYRVAAEHFCSAIDQLAASDDPLLRIQRAGFLLLRAEAYHRLKQYAEADADYRAAEAIIPNDPLIPFNRGLLVFAHSGLRRALPLCRDALDQAPDALRDHMRDVLFGEPSYHLLAQALIS